MKRNQKQVLGLFMIFILLTGCCSTCGKERAEESFKKKMGAIKPPNHSTSVK